MNTEYLLVDEFFARFEGVHQAGDASVRINIGCNLLVDVVRGEKADETP